MGDIKEACAGVRELMLEAEPAELRGAGDSPVALHVRACGDCRALATRMLDAQDDLAVALSALTQPRPHRESMSPGSAAPGRSFGSQHPRIARPSRPFRRAAIALAPLAAAALLVLMLHQQRNGDDLPPLQPSPDALAMAADRPLVNVASGDDVAIMSTTNPNITVVWYLKRER
jgi:hypothetical protein